MRGQSAAGNDLIQRLRSLSGGARQSVLGLTWLAAVLYALAPAIPSQYMPMVIAGMAHDMSSMPGMSHVMADMPADMPGHRPMDGHTADSGKPKQSATHDCPICKVAGTAMVLATPPTLPRLKPDIENRIFPSLWLPPSQRVFSAQPRGPPSQV